MESDFWNGKRVVVTGGGGFLGRRLVAKLRERGVTESDVIVPRARHYDLCKESDVRDLLLSARRAGEIDVVIHCAAKTGGIGANEQNPAHFFYDNLMMGVLMFHKSFLFGVKKFVSIGTVCSYPKVLPVPFKERNLWSGYPEETNAPYGLAKKMLIVQGKAYEEQYGFCSIHLIPTNLYGEGDNFDPDTSHVIPALVRKCVNAVKDKRASVSVWGDGTPSRDFLHVDDAAEGILLATEYYDSSDPVNLGTGREYSIKEVANMVADMTGFAGKFVWDTSRPNGQPRRLLDTSLAESKFGFTSQIGLRKGIGRVIDWYVENVYRDA